MTFPYRCGLRLQSRLMVNDLWTVDSIVCSWLQFLDTIILMTPLVFLYASFTVVLDVECGVA
jgi:hypothetical protein